MTYEVTTVETATTVYTVSADSPEEAKAKIMRGEYEGWRDLGHDDLEIINVSGPEGEPRG